MDDDDEEEQVEEAEGEFVYLLLESLSSPLCPGKLEEEEVDLVACGDGPVNCRLDTFAPSRPELVPPGEMLACAAATAANDEICW